MRQDRRRLCPVQITTVALGAAAGLLFGLAAAATWGDFDIAARDILAAAGAAAAVLTGTCWAVHSSRERDRHMRVLIDVAREDRTLLIRTLAAAAPRQAPAQTKTLPIRVR